MSTLHVLYEDMISDKNNDKKGTDIKCPNTLYPSFLFPNPSRISTKMDEMLSKDANIDE